MDIVFVRIQRLSANYTTPCLCMEKWVNSFDCGFAGLYIVLSWGNAIWRVEQRMAEFGPHINRDKKMYAKTMHVQRTTRRRYLGLLVGINKLERATGECMDG